MFRKKGRDFCNKIYSKIKISSKAAENNIKETPAAESSVKKLYEIPSSSIRANLMPYRKHAEVLEGRAVLRHNLSKDGSYQKCTDLKTGQLVGLNEGDYEIVQRKNGDFVEINYNDSYKAISDKDGKVKQLEQWTVEDGKTILTQDDKGNIIEKKLSHFDELAKAPGKLAADVDVINEVARYNGTNETTASELKAEAYKAILTPFIRAQG